MWEVVIGVGVKGSEEVRDVVNDLGMVCSVGEEVGMMGIIRELWVWRKEKL